MRRPNEKGHVETLIGFARSSYLVPVPAPSRPYGGPPRLEVFTAERT